MWCYAARSSLYKAARHREKENSKGNVPPDTLFPVTRAKLESTNLPLILNRDIDCYLPVFYLWIYLLTFISRWSEPGVPFIKSREREKKKSKGSAPPDTLFPTTRAMSGTIIQIKDDGDIKKWVDDTFPRGHKRTVHIHFLDFGKTTETTETIRRSDRLACNLSSDIRYLSRHTDGVVVTCGGQRGPHDIVYWMIHRLETVRGCNPKTDRSLVIILGEPDKAMFSLHVGHVLQMDQTDWPTDHGKTRQIQEIREIFISQMTRLPSNSLLQKQEEATPAVCVLMDSGEGSLKTALMAISRDIPLIIMKGGDGGLNYLVELHERWERQRNGNEIQCVAVPVPDSKSTLSTDISSVSDKSKELLNKLKQHLPLITIYNPEHENISLDAAIVEALIINKKEKELSAFFNSLMINQDSEQPTFTPTVFRRTKLLWGYFILSLKYGGSAAVKTFLGCLQLDYNDFHFRMLLQLYDCKNKNFLRTRKTIEELDDVQPNEKTRLQTKVKDLIKDIAQAQDLASSKRVAKEGAITDVKKITKALKKTREKVEELKKKKTKALNEVNALTETEALTGAKAYAKALAVAYAEAKSKAKNEEKALDKANAKVNDLTADETKASDEAVNMTTDLNLANENVRKIIESDKADADKARKELLINAIEATNLFYKARQDLCKYLEKPALFPLPCEGINCKHCTFTLDNLKDREYLIREVSVPGWQTCLHPVQELFLWSLLYSNSDVTIALWEYTKDRMGAALFASAVYSGMAKRKKKQMDNYYELKENSRRFKELAILTVNSSMERGEDKTDVLLRKPCPWWSPPRLDSEADLKRCPLNWRSSGPPKHFTVLDVALRTRCKAFLAQGKPYQLMTQWWQDNPNNEAWPKVQTEGMEVDVSGTFSDQRNEVQPTAGKRDKLFKLHDLISTRVRFGVCTGYQLAFILLFSYVLLMGLTGTTHGANLALIVWVGDILAEEIRQGQSANLRLKNRNSNFTSMLSCHAKCKEYFHQGWNILDAASIVLFAVGTVLAFFRNYSQAHDAGRLFLAADIILFILRFLQVFVVVKNMGVWIIMAKKMATDTMYFMWILLSIAYGYAVASESLLKTDETPPDWYQVPRKAFFSVFGDFAFDDIEDKNTSPSTWKWVPVYLGVFVVMTNVLLLNLLIARLSSLYTKMEVKAKEYQAWQTCQAILEFQHRSCLPPPCNILCAILALVLAAIRICCCSSRVGQHVSSSSENSRGACRGCNARLNPRSSDGRGRYCCCLAKNQSTEILIQRENQAEVYVKYLMHGTCLRLSLGPDIFVHKTITITTKSALNIARKTYEYTLFGKSSILIWKADPTDVIEIKYSLNEVQDQKYNTMYHEEQETLNQLSDLDKFEQMQAEWAITQLGKGKQVEGKTAQ